MAKIYGCQQVLIKCDKGTKAIIEYICYHSNSLYNCAVYYARQMWFKNKKIVSGYDLTAQLKTNPHFKAGYASSMQQTCLNVGEAFKSFRKLVTKAKTGELDQKPKPPNYRKSGGLFTVTYPKKWLKLKNGLIKFSLGRQVKAWFGISEFYLTMSSSLSWSSIKEIRILPRNRCFYAELVYQREPTSYNLEESRVLGIDSGLNNWLTCVSNIGTSFIIDGKHLKSLNQFYNKSFTKIKTGKNQGFWSNRLAKITEKRNRQMRDAVNKAAKIVVNYCLENQIGTLVFGWNQGQKQDVNMGRKTNQEFVQIPTARLKDRLSEFCKQYGIRFVVTEESYTSKASFLDHDALPKYGEKPDGWEASGKRVKRGLYKTQLGHLINADCNGAANIIRKVAMMLELDLSGISRGCLSQPKKVLLWTLQKSPRLRLTAGYANRPGKLKVIKF